MANDPKTAGAPKGAESAIQMESYFPITLTDVDLSNVIGGVATSGMPITGQVGSTVAQGTLKPHSTLMCCW
jgi:hypothetical protein